MNQYTVRVEEDENGELIIPLPDDLLNDLGWNENTTIEWKEGENGSFILSKVEEEWVLVETIQTFLHRYMVKVPKGNSDWALDTVTMNEANEFSQRSIGEQIISHRIVTEEEALDLCDKDNDYCLGWTKQQKLEAFFTTVGE